MKKVLNFFLAGAGLIVAFFLLVLITAWIQEDDEMKIAKGVRDVIAVVHAEELVSEGGKTFLRPYKQEE